MMTRNNSGSATVPAEWQNAGAVLMALPHPDTDWADMLDEAIDCFRNMIKAIAEHSVVVLLVPSPEYARERVGDLLDHFRNRIVTVSVATNDTWTRDYGPVTRLTSDGRAELRNYTFNGWGLKFASNFDNQVNKQLQNRNFWQLPMTDISQIVLEGGSIDSDGNGHMLTTAECLLSPNRNPWMTRAEIETTLVKQFGLKKLLWIDHGYLAGDDTDSHVDTLARFAPNNVIVYVECHNTADEHYEQLAAMKQDLLALTDSDGRPFNLVGLPMPDAICHPDDNHRLPATYANFLVLPDAVIVPTYNQSLNDELALRIIESVYERPAIGVDCRALIKQHGSLHCSTMQFPIEALPI